MRAIAIIAPIFWVFFAFKSSLCSSLPNLLVDYSFRRSECLQNSFSSESSSMVGSLVSTSSESLVCPLSNGVSSGNQMLRSDRNVTDLKEILQNSNFTVEMWIRPALDDVDNAILLSIGSEESNSYSMQVSPSFYISF